jgi:hypothetical protein
MVPDSEGVMDDELSTFNKRDSTRVLEKGRGDEDEGVEVHTEPMKTMAELAAEHAERELQLRQGSTRGSKPSRRTVRTSRARRKLVDDESEDEPHMDDDLLEPSLTDEPSGHSPPKRRRAASSRAPPKTNTRSSSKSTPKKRPRGSDIEEGSDIEYEGSSKSRATSTGRHPRRATAAGIGKLEPRATGTVSGSSAASVVVPVSDRVLRSRKVRV